MAIVLLVGVALVDGSLLVLPWLLAHCYQLIVAMVSNRLKHHLAGTQKDVGAYTTISDEVKKQMWDAVSGLQVNLIKKTSMDVASPGGATREVDMADEKRKGN
ncbi:hypothetical protein PIB30_059036 [Stylosanthes scabra]|uniref:ABC transmembrane type-1 domain-containing protein n=1 Tax=Stylosanthes scabra TaxID=79078 RepID=A0ABU6UMI2_9FABA|nr:hypothetical protein [Stylosanthes scabra]